MASRKKGKKGNKSKSKGDEPDKSLKLSPCTFFTSNELTQIKIVLQVKEVLGIPIALGCVILNKADALTSVVKSVDINEIGPNNTTALLWAVRNKYLDIIEILLDNGADPMLKVDYGEHIATIALDNKLWDEDSFMAFWNMLSSIVSIDLNITNKTGHTILHIAVRREWENFIEKIIWSEDPVGTSKADPNITNINGVTPLMTACFRNNLRLVNNLINHGADIATEDNHYRTALCYTIFTCAKSSKPPFEVAENILFQMKKNFSFKEYIKRRIIVIEIVLSKEKISETEINMLVNVMRYMVQFTENGLKIVMECKLLRLVHQIFQTDPDDKKKKLLLQLTHEMLWYNEHTVGYNIDIQSKLVNQIYHSNIIYCCMEIIKNKEANHDVALNILMLFCTVNDAGKRWMKSNCYSLLRETLQMLPDDYLQRNFSDEKKQTLVRSFIEINELNFVNQMEQKIKVVKRLIFEEAMKDSVKEIKSKTAISERKSEMVFNIKKPTRKSKLIKSKINKMKNLELAERLSFKERSMLFGAPHRRSDSSSENVSIENKIANLGTDVNKNAKFMNQPILSKPERGCGMLQLTLEKEIEEQQNMVNGFMTDDLFCPLYSYHQDEENPICTALQQFLKVQKNECLREESYCIPEYPAWRSKILRLPFNDWSMFSKKMKIDKNKLKVAMLYMKKISANCDNTTNAAILDAAVKVVIDYFKELLDIIITRLKDNLELDAVTQTNKKANNTEKQDIHDLQANFHNLISSISSLAHSNLPEALRNIYQLESTLLKFPIKGKTLMGDVCALEEVKFQYTVYSQEAESNFIPYIENVLNGFEETRDDIKITSVDETLTAYEREPPDLYEYETSLLSPIQRNAVPTNLSKVENQTDANAYHLVESIERLLEEEPLKDKFECKVFSEKRNQNETYRSRWAEKIKYLNALKNTHYVLGSQIKVWKFPERSQVISQGGNFNIVALGFSANNHPLAVKKIPSEHWVSKIIKSLISPLLTLRHKHILNYFACDYEENELILATPLCEYNIGQYVLLMNEGTEKNVFNLTQMDIVRQFLNGLAVLHHRIDPIVHGNLKPSNIFVDMRGVVRLAEFGINTALFKLVEAPKTSLIWFSQESYRVYKRTSTMECTLLSDIQVAGMMIYFIMSGGEHPFGPELTSILKNLEKSTFTIPLIREVSNQIFADLISWMLMYEPNDRPNIKQVLSHVLFWSNERKWNFILNCAGVSTNGVPLAVDVVHLHRVIEETSVKEGIKGHWVNIVRRKFPGFQFIGEDTVMGLLKFIKQFYDAHVNTKEEAIRELENCVLTYFPAFPLTLYRILEAGGIMKEYPFISYTSIEHIPVLVRYN